MRFWKVGSCGEVTARCKVCNAHKGAPERQQADAMRGADVWASETYKLLAPYQNKRPGRVLALNKGRWGLPDEKRGEAVAPTAVELAEKALR